MRRLVGIIAALVVSATLSAESQVRPGPRGTQPPPETIEIDGSKNPELVPQWSAWEFAFRVMAGGSRELPTIVHLAVLADEEAMILREAETITKRAAACEARMGKLRVLIERKRRPCSTRGPGKSRSTAAGRRSTCGTACWIG